MLPAWGAITLLSAAGTWAARRYALRRSLVDQPGERRSHRVATPRGGGVGPVLAVLAGLAMLAVAGTIDMRYALGTGLGLLAVAAVGWWDDHRPLPAWSRFLVHVAAGVVLAFAAGLWTQSTLLALVGVVLTATLVNVWNFMDGIDGIATLQAAVVAFVALLLLGDGSAGLAAIVTAACIGFLPFNFPRARIFLGDVGSGALGFMLASLVARPVATEPFDGLLLMFPLGVFLVDAGLTLGGRVLRGEAWWTPHTQHLYQAAARRLGHAPVTLGYAVAAAGGGALALALRGADAAFIMASLAVWYTACALSWVILQRVAAGRGALPEKDR